MQRQTVRFELGCGPQALDVMVAATPLERMQGLLGRAPLQAFEAMLLRSCRLVHTIGMGYPLDLVYLKRDGTVLKVTQALPARRIDGHWRAHSVLEMAAGMAATCGIRRGDRLLLDQTEAVHE